MAFRPSLKKTIAGLLEDDWENMNDLLNAIADAVDEEAKPRQDWAVLCKQRGGMGIGYGPYPTALKASKEAEKIGALIGPERMWVIPLVHGKHWELQEAVADKYVRKSGDTK